MSLMCWSLSRRMRRPNGIQKEWTWVIISAAPKSRLRPAIPGMSPCTVARKLRLQRATHCSNSGFARLQACADSGTLCPKTASSSGNCIQVIRPQLHVLCKYIPAQQWRWWAQSAGKHACSQSSKSMRLYDPGRLLAKADKMTRVNEACIANSSISHEPWNNWNWCRKCLCFYRSQQAWLGVSSRKSYCPGRPPLLRCDWWVKPAYSCVSAKSIAVHPVYINF